MVGVAEKKWAEHFSMLSRARAHSRLGVCSALGGGMASNSVIITINLLKSGESHDLEVPLDISASELCSALFQNYLPEQHGGMQQHYLKAERPIVLLRGERTLREYGLRDGSVINIRE